jgi:hypothetical protein
LAIEGPCSTCEPDLASATSVQGWNIARYTLAGEFGLTALCAVIDCVTTITTFATAVAEAAILTFQVLGPPTGTVRRDVGGTRRRIGCRRWD